MLDFPSLLHKGLRILMFQLSGVYCSRWYPLTVSNTTLIFCAANLHSN